MGLRFSYIVVILFLMTLSLEGQVKIDLPAAFSQNSIRVENGTITGDIDISGLFGEEIEIHDTTYIRLWYEGSVPTGEIGMPEFPGFTQLVEIPLENKYQIEIVKSDSVVFQLGDIFREGKIIPVQPSVMKSQNKMINSFSPVGAVYENNKNQIISLNPEGRIRGINLAHLEIRPFRYHPETNELTVFFSLSYRIEPLEDSFSEMHEPGLPAPFRRALKRVSFDENRSLKKKILQDQPMTLVILSDSMFHKSLEPLVTWKTQKGFRVIEAYTSNPRIGKTNYSIREYLKSLYFEPPNGFSSPTYLLIVGDVEHVPLSQSSGQITDLYYTTYDGEGDYLPELFHGRISVKDTTELNNIVEKILKYEKYQFPDPSYLDRSILIAGYDASYASTHGNGQINYASNYYFNADNGIDALVYRHPEASSMDNEILNEISAGASFVNYTGHGEYYGWLNPVFQLQHIDTMKNFHKYSFMIGNGCSTNQFNMSNDCFAEAVLKIKDRGAIGYIGCTNDSYWNEDYYWSVGLGEISSTPLFGNTGYGYYDKVFHYNIEETALWAPSMGEMIFAGNMTVQESSSTKKQYYWEIYQLMGDPTLVPWFKDPAASSVLYPDQLPPDATRFSFSGRSYDYVAISSGGALVTAMHAGKDGNLYIDLPDSIQNKDLQIVVTGDQRQPHIDSIQRSDNYGPYLEIIDYIIVEEDVASDEIISSGESFSVDLVLVNSGDVKSGGYNLKLLSGDDLVFVIDSMASAGNVPAGDTIRVENAFRLRAQNNIKDLSRFFLEIQANDGKSENSFFIQETIHAPELLSVGIFWDDRPGGNGNGIIEPGENLNFTWRIKNAGSYKADSIQLMLKDAVPYFHQFYSERIRGLSVNQVKDYVFNARFDSLQKKDTVLSVEFLLTSGFYDLYDSLCLVVNKHFEDFSHAEGDPRYNFLGSENPWISDSLTYFSGPFSMRSGKIDHNQQSSLMIEFENEQLDSISFYYKISSEAHYDYLNFLVDGVTVKNWSGNVGWSKMTHILEPGFHVFEWQYVKDMNTIGGSDAAWIDFVEFPGSMVISKDLGVNQIVKPFSDAFLTNQEQLTIEVSNNGNDTIVDFSAGYSLNKSFWHTEQFSETILPGVTKEITFSEPLDLSELEKYELKAGIQLQEDQYPGNDYFHSLVEHYIYPDMAIEYMGADSVSSVYLDAILKLHNLGNIEISEWNYSIYLDEVLLGDNSEIVDLLPDQFKEVQVNLISPKDSLQQGWYRFKIVSEPDSVHANNLVEYEVYWAVQSVPEDRGGDLKISPNPANDSFIVSLNEEFHLPVTLKIFDLSGKIISEANILRRIQRFNTANIFDHGGIYILEVTDKKGKKERIRLSVTVK